jgi:hypothetical protein
MAEWQGLAEQMKNYPFIMAGRFFQVPTTTLQQHYSD